MKTFHSDFKEIGPIKFPVWTGIRIQMMPFVMHDMASLPPELAHWLAALTTVMASCREIVGVGYLTIDERVVKAGETHRRPGLHVDGMGNWGGGSWGAKGMFMASGIPLNGNLKTPTCAAWRQDFIGSPLSGADPGDPMEGNCDHLRPQCLLGSRTLLKPDTVYWCDSMCVHESLPMPYSARRTFVRVSMPSDCPWPANCTPNPCGIKPGGPIAEPRRTEAQYRY